MDTGELAEKLHDEYERLSKETGWETQKICKVKFDELPEKNKQVMLGMAEFVKTLRINYETN
jgi:hypothetical protein